MEYGLGLIGRLLNIYGWIILAYILLGWFVVSSQAGWVRDAQRALAPICEPYLSLFRRILPPISAGAGGIDFSPVIALVVLRLVANALSRF